LALRRAASLSTRLRTATTALVGHLTTGRSGLSAHQTGGRSPQQSHGGGTAFEVFVMVHF
jgi:hypothetical protein